MISTQQTELDRLLSDLETVSELAEFLPSPWTAFTNQLRLFNCVICRDGWGGSLGGQGNGERKRSRAHRQRTRKRVKR